jgi:broad-specificity NMP kinase
MKNQWQQSTNNFFIREVSQNIETLKPLVYKLEIDERTGELYLSQILDKFDFPYKVYGIETDFIDRVEKTYNNTKSNLGILLNGIKGTGKTVTAKQICNKLDLPVIIIHTRYDNTSNFINNIQQDVIVFVDEYEKMYNDKDHSILTVMDGVLDNGFRRVFLLTTNELYINSNMIQRPGRLRYLKTYGNLPLEAIEEIIDDKLIYLEHRPSIIEFILQLETITVDIVKAVIDEVNIHNEDPKVFKDIFNIQILDPRFNVYKTTPGQKVPELTNNAKIYPIKFDQSHVDTGSYFLVNGDDVGVIVGVIDENTVQVKEWKHKNKNEEGKYIVSTYKVEEIKQYHYGYAF